jgi:hypothetical protein
VFVRQGPRSNYCAPYATAAFVGLLGQPMGRAEALRTFRTRRAGWRGASRADIARVVCEACPGVRASWQHVHAASAGDLLGRLREAWDGRPLLATASCLLLRHQVTDRHTFVIVALADEAVKIIDPLFRPPAAGQCGNMELRLVDGRAQTSNPSSRLAWAIDLGQPLCLMRWSTQAGAEPAPAVRS